MKRLIDLDRFPLDRLQSAQGRALIARCKGDLAREGMFNLEGLVPATAVAEAVRELAPVLATEAYTHSRRHNIYFKREIAGLDPDHPALAEFETVNHTICADQMPGTVVMAIYEFEPLAAFLAAVMEKPSLYLMADPLARANVMQYQSGEALNWHFDRSEFTTTLLLQAPDQGGAFQYARELRSEHDPNYEGVADLLRGELPVEEITLAPGTLNVFRGKNTAHRVTPVAGDATRIIAVFSYYETPGVMFSQAERLGFYGRAGASTA
ncbi:MAG: 2OG-Fe(II) oxygenase [Pseudomonadota bacterium]